MMPEPGNLLETDRIEDVLADAPQAAPVVVVQARGRSRPWLLISGTIAAVGLGGAYTYHRREVARLNVEAELARRDYQRALEKARDEENELRLKAVPVPADPPAVPPSVPAVATAPPPSPPAAEAPAPLPEKAAPASPPVVAAVEPPIPPPFDEPEPAPARVDLAAAPATAPVVERPSPAPAPAPVEPVPADQPLPSREETERQLRAEAAEIGRDNQQKRGQQREELLALRDDERRQFLDELRMILKVQGRGAGPEIQRLSDRSGRSGDPKLLMHARIVIAETRTSQRAKVRRLRELGVPETVILDYLANAMKRNLKARNGPRNRNEIWVKAGELLVRYHDLDESRPTAAATGPR